MLLEHRVQSTNLTDEASWKRLVPFIQKHRGIIDSLALVDDVFHNAYHDMEHNRRMAALLRERMLELKAIGIPRVGFINIGTIGHIDEAVSFLPQPLPPMTGYDGRVSGTCICPNHPECRAHIVEEYSLYASMKPDFLWVDDDIKIHTNGIRFGCFCPHCIAKFNASYGYAYADRETLVSAMDDPKEKKLRADWVSFISDTITSLFTEIEGAIHSVDPNIETGFMTMRQSWSTYNGEDFPRWFEALKGVKARSGEGMYDETEPFAIVKKALDTAQQMEAYPKRIRERFYEIENFPYCHFQKSKRYLTSEYVLAGAQNFNAALVNMLHIEKGADFEDNAHWFEALEACRGQLDALTELNADTHGDGFWSAISERYDAIRTLEEGDTFFKYVDERNGSNPRTVYNLCAAGFPLTADRHGAKGVVFIGDMVNGFTDDELIEWFKKGVLMDSCALEELEKRGLGRYAGVRSVGRHIDGVYERYEADEPMNAGFRELYRDIRQAFWGGVAHGLEPVADGVRVLSNLESYTGETLGAACTLYENELGGRVCVLGYGAFTRIDSAARHTQLRRIADWLTRGELAVTREADGRMGHFIRTSDQHTVAAFINLYLDDQLPTEITLRDVKTAYQLLPDGSKALLAVREGGRVTLPEIRPFETIVAVGEK